MLSLVHMSGDPKLIRGRLRPAGLFLNEVQGYMTEEDKAEARALALDIIRDYRDRGCPEPAPISAELLHEMMAGWSARRCPTSTSRCCSRRWSSTARDARRVEPAGDADARAAFPVVVIGCGAVRACWPASGSPRPASPSPSWRRTPGSAAPGGRTATRAPGSTSATTSTATRFEPSDHWTEYFAQQPELQRYFQSVMDKHGIEPHVRWETEVIGGDWDDDAGHLAGPHPRRRRHRGRARRPARSSRRWVSSTGPTARHQRRRHFDGPAVPLGPLGPLRRPGRQAGGHDRRRRQRLPDRPDDRPRRRAAHRLPAHRAVDVPQPELPRAGRPGSALGAAPPAVLRPVVPVPDLLAGLRQGARGGPGRPGLPRPAAGGQRDERADPPDVHRLDRQPGRRRSGAARQGDAGLSGDRQAHPAGQRQLAAAP